MPVAQFGDSGIDVRNARAYGRILRIAANTRSPSRPRRRRPQGIWGLGTRYSAADATSASGDSPSVRIDRCPIHAINRVRPMETGEEADGTAGAEWSVQRAQVNEPDEVAKPKGVEATVDRIVSAPVALL